MKIYDIIYIVCLITIIVIGCIHTTSGMIGGSREAIFSRFNYTPDFPMISQLDTVNFDRFSKVYNIAGSLKFIGGRPYRYYKSEDSTWLYPWDFPQEIDRHCTQKASQKCHEPPVILVKKEVEKLNGLATKTPADIVHVSPCFLEAYEKCQKEDSSS